MNLQSIEDFLGMKRIKLNEMLNKVLLKPKLVILYFSSWNEYCSLIKTEKTDQYVLLLYVNI